MMSRVEMPLWALVLLIVFAAVTFASHFLFPSVRWFFRRRLERAVARLNNRLTRPIEPFKLARRHDMIQRLVYDPEVTQAIVDHARRNSVREDVAFQLARKYAREIVPSFSAFAYFGLGTRVAGWIARGLYDIKTGRDNDQILAGIDKDATVIFIMNHRSNMDYVLVTMLAARASALSYAVGEWARVWPLSWLIKSMGAYFIRRKSRGRLYRRVLSRYVQMATDNGVDQAVFPEGGLSQDGLLKPPKLGILSYVATGTGREVVFVPVAINYDRVLEDRVLIGTAARGDGRFRARMSVVFAFTARMIWRRMRGLYRPFGTAAVIFGEPMSLGEHGGPGSLGPLATDLMGRIASEMPLLYMPLMAKVMLEADAPLGAEDLSARVQAAHAQVQGIVTLLPDEEPGFRAQRARERLAMRNLIVERPEGWIANPDETALLQYYANSIAHLFATPLPALPPAPPPALPPTNAAPAK